MESFCGYCKNPIAGEVRQYKRMNCCDDCFLKHAKPGDAWDTGDATPLTGSTRPAHPELSPLKYSSQAKPIPDDWKPVRLVQIDVSFANLVGFWFKLTFAAIPVGLICWVLWFMLSYMYADVTRYSR